VGNLFRIFETLGIPRWAVSGVTRIIDEAVAALARGYAAVRNTKTYRKGVEVGAWVFMVGWIEDLYEKSGVHQMFSEAYLMANGTIDDIILGWMGYVVGVKPDGLHAEQLKTWAGKIVGKQIKQATGWEISTVWPPEALKTEVVAMVTGAVVNGTGMVGTLQVMSGSRAVQLANTITTNYLKENSHKNTLHKQQKATWRRNHPMVQLRYDTRNPIHNKLVKEAIAAIIARRKVLRAARYAAMAGAGNPNAGGGV